MHKQKDNEIALILLMSYNVILYTILVDLTTFVTVHVVLKLHVLELRDKQEYVIELFSIANKNRHLINMMPEQCSSDRHFFFLSINWVRCLCLELCSMKLLIN